MRPDVAVIVATHDRPVMLETELRSILLAAARAKHNGTSVQVLVVDDASETMAAREVAKRLGVDYLRRRTNGGVAATLVTGYEATDSIFSTFWGDDDFMLPRWFLRHLAAASVFDVVAGSYYVTDERLRPTKRKRLKPLVMRELLADIVRVNDGALVRRSVVDAVGWRPERGRAMLLTMWLALAARGARFTAISEPTWLYRRHPGQLSEHWDEQSRALRAEAIAEYTAVAA